jgi:hypothetical protein
MKIQVAIAYDFDGTLAPDNMQERDFIPALGLKPKEYWKEAKELATKYDMDEILAYLNLMLQKAQAKGLKIDKKTFTDFGQKLILFPGVESWFKRVNAHGKKAKVSVEHYIISSGLREMIAGTSIAKEFKYIFASGFRYDQHDVAIWPALAVNYTNKSQYLFRINKGIMNSYDNSTINKFMRQEDRRVPFSNMIYIGDGETDIPAMKMITYQGGRAIAVYRARKKGAKHAAKRLVTEERANAAVPADFRKNSDLEKAVKATIDEIAAKSRFFVAAKIRRP